LSDVEILARIERRRKWTVQEKAALLAEVDAEGGKVRMVARRHRISESLLYNWRSSRKAAASAVGAPEAMEFMPIGVFGGVGNQGPVMLAPPEPERVQQPQASEGGAGTIEIALPNGTRICVDTSVNEKALSRVLRAMRVAL
jgi:transposase